MTQIDDLPPLRSIIQAHELNAKKSLGQNFLLDLNLTTKIARVSGALEDVIVVEVGPGPGGLTRALLALGAKKVIAIERDTRCIQALSYLQEKYKERFKLIEADALEFDYTSVADFQKTRIIANLPYNIATPLLTMWLTQKIPAWYESMALMFQKEVAERITAKPRTKAYGRLSVLAQALCEVEIAFDIPPSAFVPAPKVTSSVVYFKPKPSAVNVPISALERLTHAAFGQRRKMLRQSLKTIHVDIESILNQLHISPTARAEELEVDDFIALADKI